MLGCTVGGYIKSCTTVTGGVDQLLIGDANDFDFTSGADDANGDDTGYSTIARHAGATASDTVSGVSISNGGSAYTTATVNFTGGGGTGAAGTAVISGGAIVGVTMTNNGSGYTSAPAVSFTGDGSGAVATSFLSTGGAYLFEIDSIIDTIGVDIAQSNADGSNSSYEYTITARLAQMSQALTNFNKKIDGAALCCQLVFVWRMNDGRIFVIGEKYVDATAITRFRFRQDGSRISTGKKFTDFNGEDLSIKGSYSRLPYEFTGDWTDITDFQYGV